MSQIRTDRLLLRAPRLSDANWITSGLGNMAVAQNMLVPHPFSMDHALDWLENRQRPDTPGNNENATPREIRFCIEHEKDGGIGIVSFRTCNGSDQLGYWLAEPFWGRGIMSEALRETLRWYYERAQADIVTSGVFYFNMASLAVQHKLGFVETDRSMVYCPARGADIEHINTELTRDAFEAAIS